MTDAAPDDPVSGARKTQVTQVVWRHADTTAYVDSAERVVVVDLDHPELPPYVFEGTAAQIWACLDGDRTETDIVTDLAEAYDVSAEVVTPDVRQFVDELRDLGLILAAGSDG